MSTKQIKIQTVAEYLKQVSEIKQQWPNSVLAFRGQEDEKWCLESSAERRLKQSGNQGRRLDQLFIEYHKNLLSKCKLKNYDRREGKPLHELELLANLRHYGAATCLIDFTRNALVALWFACEKSQTDGKVFVVNIAEQTFLEIAPGDINDKSIEKILRFQTREKGQATEPQDKEAFKATPSSPSFWHWKPAHLNERITAQHSLFLFGLPSSREMNVVTIIIKSANKEGIRKELKEIHNIHEESLFPDFVGFAYTQRHNAPYTTLDAEGYFRRGLGAQQQGDLDQAIQDYSEAIELKPDFAEAYYHRGVAYQDKGDYDHAIQDFDKAIALKPNDVNAYNNRGVAYGKKGELGQATQDYNKAIELKPDFAEAYNNRGNAYGKKGELDQAIQDYNKAIELKPDFAEAYNNRGNAYAEKGDYDQAIRDFNKAIELNPDLAEAYNNRGSAYADQGNFNQAIRDFNKAIELNPDYAEAYYNRGLAYGRKGNLDQAIRDFTKAIELKPDYADAYYNLGIAYYLKGELDQAILNYSKAIELKPNLAEAYNNRGAAYQDKGELDQAIQDFNKAIELKPDLSLPYFNRGVAWLLMQEWDNARADLQTAREKSANIVKLFSNDHGSLSAFEQKYKVQLPADLREMLTA